jgi:hypothetical protein
VLHAARLGAAQPDANDGGLIVNAHKLQLKIFLTPETAARSISST